jgi:hypothetical protein
MIVWLTRVDKLTGSGLMGALYLAAAEAAKIHGRPKPEDPGEDQAGIQARV